MKCKYSIEQLKLAVANSMSFSETCRQVGIRPVGANVNSIRLKIKKYCIDNSHFTGQGWNVGKRFKSFGKKYKLKDILVENSQYRCPSKLKYKLIEEGLKVHECEICKNTTWMGQKIKLEIHHINGINTDNRIENLQILCPNCHAFTDNYRGKNGKKSALSEKREVEYRKFREAPAEMRGNPEPSPNSREGAETLHGKPKSKRMKLITCFHCGNKFLNKQGKFCSVECYRESNSSNRPSVIDLLNVIERNNYNFVAVAKFYNVSDNAVRKWCKLYKILDMVKRKSRPQINE